MNPPYTSAELAADPFSQWWDWWQKEMGPAAPGAGVSGPGVLFPKAPPFIPQPKPLIPNLPNVSDWLAQNAWDLMLGVAGIGTILIGLWLIAGSPKPQAIPVPVPA